MVRAPPDLGREVVAGIAQGLDGDGEQQRLADGGTLRAIALLARLGPEGRPVRRDDDTGDDLAFRFLELRDLRGEIVGQVLVAAGIDEAVALLQQNRREAELGVAPGIAVAIVRERPPTILLVSSWSHIPVNTAITSSSPQKK